MKKGYDNFIIEANGNFLDFINCNEKDLNKIWNKIFFVNVIDIIRNTKYFEETKPYIIKRLDKV